jgi:hypothetical protein
VQTRGIVEAKRLVKTPKVHLLGSGLAGPLLPKDKQRYGRKRLTEE